MVKERRGGQNKTTSSLVDVRSGVNYANFPDDQKNAILWWETSSRSIRAGKTERDQQLAQSLENYISENPKANATETLYRGIVMDNNDLTTMLWASFSGEATDQKGLSSWSSEKRTSLGFAGVHGGEAVNRASGRTSVVFVSNGMKAKNGRYLPTTSQDEHEMIVSSKAKFRIKSYEIDETTGTYFVYVEDV